MLKKKLGLHPMRTDEAYLAFEIITEFANQNKERIESEQDARFQLIDRVLTEVLFWPRAGFATELHVGEGRMDYLLSVAGKNKLVVEAKRYSETLLDTMSDKLNYYKYDGPVAKTATSVLRQTEGYCLDVGVPFCAITNGHEWIGHWCVRGDGRRKTEYKIVAFPSLSAIKNDFSKFYEIFSYEGVLKEFYKIYLNDSEGVSVHRSENLYGIRDSSQPTMMSKSPLARDIDKIFTSFFSSMAGDDDPEMLINCFVESKESKETDLSLQKIARNIIDQIDYVEASHTHGLIADIRDAVAREKGDFALIIGNKGAGKSTYIDRFFRATLDPETRRRCLVLRIDLRASSGNITGIVEWLDGQLSKLAEKALFDNELTFEDLQGVFFREYRRWYMGEMKFLYDSDKTAFKIEFGKFVQNQRLNEHGKYLSALLWHAVGGRQMMPCLVFDNADHYSKEFQEAVFQYAQSLFREIKPCFVICPVTDRTIWQLSKSGPFQSYQYKAFYLPTPVTKEILQKRLTFLQEKINVAFENPQEQYFLSKGIRVSVQDINAFAACIETIFVETDYISRLIGSLCNHDIRRTLELTRRTLTSPHIAIDDLVRTYLSQSSRIRIPPYKVKKAIFLADYNYFSQTENSFVLNVYTIEPEQVSTPLARLSILQALKQKSSHTDDSEAKYIDAFSLSSFLEPIGLSKKTTMAHLEQLFKYRLVEAYDPTSDELNESTRMRITPSGLMHIELGIDDAAYFEYVGLSTPMRMGERYSTMRSIITGKFYYDAWVDLKKHFLSYLLEQDEIFCPSAEKLGGQEIVRATLRRNIQR